MLSPNHKGRSADEILGENIYFDSVGYLFRAASWVDHYKRNNLFTSLIYGCTEARLGIEYLMFEDLIISTGANLSEGDYKKCIKDNKKFVKMIKQLSPDYEKLKEFTRVVISLDPYAPNLIFWNHSELLKNWGKLSNYLHWYGVLSRTTGDQKWVEKAESEITDVVNSMWEKITSGKMGLMHTSGMEPKTMKVWEDFKDGKTDFEGLKIRLEIIK